MGSKPAVDSGQIKNLFQREAGAEGVADEKDALRVGHAQLAGDDFARENVAVAVNVVADAPGLAVAPETAPANLQAAQTFLNTVFECAPDGHRFTDRFHLEVKC